MNLKKDTGVEETDLNLIWQKDGREWKESG